MADPPEPEAEVSPRATVELSALFVNLTIRGSAPATGAPAARAAAPPPGARAGAPPPAASSSESRPGPQPAASEARGPSPEPSSARPRGSPPKRFYAVVRCTDDKRVVGVYHCTWEELRAKLPGGRLQTGKTYLRGFDTAGEAEVWFVNERKVQHERGH